MCSRCGSGKSWYLCGRSLGYTWTQSIGELFAYRKEWQFPFGGPEEDWRNHFLSQDIKAIHAFLQGRVVWHCWIPFCHSGGILDWKAMWRWLLLLGFRFPLKKTSNRFLKENYREKLNTPPKINIVSSWKMVVGTVLFFGSFWDNNLSGALISPPSLQVVDSTFKAIEGTKILISSMGRVP